MAKELSTFYSHDHDRLDGLFKSFQDLKTKDPGRAKEHLAQFRAGLEQHMAWEEAILFPEYDGKFGGSGEDSITQALLGEHAEILGVLDRIDEKVAEGVESSHDESRLLKILGDHNRNEETGLYPQVDSALDEIERSAVFTAMEQSAWNK